MTFTAYGDGSEEALEKGGADISYLEKFVYSLLDEEKFWNSEIDFALVTVEYPYPEAVGAEKERYSKRNVGRVSAGIRSLLPCLSDKGNQWTEIH